MKWNIIIGRLVLTILYALTGAIIRYVFGFEIALITMIATFMAHVEIKY